jgi:hypothetical protein
MIARLERHEAGPAAPHQLQPDEGLIDPVHID